MSPILPLHLLSLAYVAWNIFHADHMGFSWVRGKVHTLDEKRVRKYHRGTWVGLVLMITTGVLLFIPMREYLLGRPQFFMKMAFVFTLICNGLVIGTLQKTATSRPYASLTSKEKAPLFISGAISTICWIGAAVTALFLVEEF